MQEICIEALIPYADEGLLFEGFAVYPTKKKQHVIILCHAWKGRDEFICEKTRLIASLGYIGFAIDMYGKGVLGTSKEECAALKKSFLKDRKLLQKRILKGFKVAKNLPYVDSNQIAVVLGYRTRNC